MIIDAHQHYWLTSRTDYGWLRPSVGKIYADYMPEQLKPLLRQFGIEKTVLVQAAPSLEETEFLLAIADREETVAGVVGWLDFESKTFEADWNRFRRHSKFVGVRPMIQDLPSEWVVRDVVVDHMKLLADAGFPVDLQANPRHLTYLLRLLEQVPHLRAVVDHLAKPQMQQGALEPWATGMAGLAACPGLYCKLSGMVPEVDDAPWTAESIRPFAEAALGAFGPKRVLFGSDWPVCLKSASYGEVVALFESCLGPDIDEDVRRDVYGNNAIQFYGLSRTG